MPMQISISNVIGGDGGVQGGSPAFTNTKSILLDSSNSDFVTMGNASSLDFDLTDALSISAWIKSTGTGEMTIASKKEAGLGIGYEFVEQDGKLIFSMKGSSKSAILVRTGNSIVDNTWHHVAVTYSGSGLNTGLKLYLDGALQSTSNQGTEINPITNSAPFNLGAQNDSQDFWNGNLDEVSVFNSELTASNITTIYGTGVPNDISGLSPLSWWRCGDGDVSPTLTDNGSGGNNGTMTNFTTFSTDVPT